MILRLDAKKEDIGFSKLIFHSIVNPDYIIDNTLTNIKGGIIIFALSQISVALSFMYSLNFRVMPFTIFSISIIFVLYFLLVNMTNIMVINTIGSLVSHFKYSRNTSTFISSILKANGIYILIMPISLLFSFLPKDIFSNTIYLVYFIMNIYYMFLVIRIVKNTFMLKSNFGVFMLFISPAVISFLYFIVFTIFYLYTLMNVILKA